MTNKEPYPVSNLLKITVGELKTIAGDLSNTQLKTLAEMVPTKGIQDICKRELFSRLEVGDKVVLPTKEMDTVKEKRSGGTITLEKACGFWGWKDCEVGE